MRSGMVRMFLCSFFKENKVSESLLYCFKSTHKLLTLACDAVSIQRADGTGTVPSPFTDSVMLCLGDEAECLQMSGVGSRGEVEVLAI